MRTRLAGLSVVVALAGPVALMGVSAASASAAGTTCTGNSGWIKLSPGLSESAQVQNVSIKGTLSGCTGSTVTKGSYVAQLKTTHAVTCAALAGAGEPATGSIVIKWSPKGQGNSMGTFSMPLTALAGVSIGGTLEKGPFSVAGISGTVSQSFSGACGGGKGKKKAKKLKDGSFTGSEVVIS
jgi:hypothetical protein